MSSSARWARAAAYAESKGPAWAPRPREPWGGALPSAESPGGGGGALSRAEGSSWWCSPRAGESWRRDAPESGGGWSVLFSARTGESTLWVGGSRWWCGGPSSVSSPEPASGYSPRLESRDLERALPSSWTFRLGRVEGLSLPRASLVDMLLIVACRDGIGRRGCGGRWRDGNDA